MKQHAYIAKLQCAIFLEWVHNVEIVLVVYLELERPGDYPQYGPSLLYITA